MTRSASIPRVSVGLPVYNGAAYLRQAVDSVLAQSLRNLELIISDNGSADETERICREFACRDSRVRYHRSEINRGASWNFNHVALLARGEFFKWMAADDEIAPQFLARCVEVMDADPSVAMCCPRVIDIDERGRFRKARAPDLNLSDHRPHRRFRDLVCVNHSCFRVFGVTRLDVLKRTAMVASYVGSDRVLLAEIGLIGRFHELEECLFLHREHGLRSTRALPVLQERIGWFDPNKAGRLNFPNWRMLLEYAKCVRRSKLHQRQRIACYLELLLWLRLNRRLLVSDLAYAGRKVLKRRVRRRAAGQGACLLGPQTNGESTPWEKA